MGCASQKQVHESFAVEDTSQRDDPAAAVEESYSRPDGAEVPVRDVADPRSPMEVQTDFHDKENKEPRNSMTSTLTSMTNRTKDEGSRAANLPSFISTGLFPSQGTSSTKQDDEQPVKRLSKRISTFSGHGSRCSSCSSAGLSGMSRSSGTAAPRSQGSKTSSAAPVAKTLPLLKAPGSRAINVLPNKLDKSQLNEFRECLARSGIDTKGWGLKGTKSVEHLFWETFVQRGCIITKDAQSGKLKRVTRIVKISLVADILGVEHKLQSRLQFMHDGQCIERTQVLVKRLCWFEESTSKSNMSTPFDDTFIEEHCRSCESWSSGVKSALQDRLGLSLLIQDQHLLEQQNSYTYRVEDTPTSGGFPGLETQYCIHEITVVVANTEAPAVQCLGLPTGQEFATTEGDFNLSMQMQNEEEGLPLGTQLNIWCWVRCTVTPGSARPRSDMQMSPSQSLRQIFLKRVPQPNSSVGSRLSDVRRLARKESIAGALPSPALQLLQNGCATDWALAKHIAHRIAEPDYSLKEYTKDLQAFPELELYLLDDAELDASVSGRTLDDEFQRTIGAFYAIYWLMRLGIDGKEGFSFGVDDSWAPIRHDKLENYKERTAPVDKRVKFFKESSWNDFEQLLIDAEMLVKTGDGNTTKVNEDRVLTLLALTAIHDIMKVQILLPKVQLEHAPYHGYQAGDLIGDHDHALSYVMEHFPNLLPSFSGLDERERFSVAFTQCQLQFNHGWFVQAEAPPGAIFKKFRELLIRDHQSKVMPKDIALYFVHWLTDLAGAEPTPLGGCEKFVIKFPLAVLNSFLRSFSFIEQLTHSTETEVMEEYLKIRWKEHVPDVGPLPTGDAAVAKMRLLCMSQSNAGKILAGFEDLTSDDRDILSVEMARTGCMGQSFSKSLAPEEVQSKQMGPALLIYYGPAFLQNLGSDSPSMRLSLLVEVYRAARELWPVSVAQVSTSVIVRIDTVKGLSCHEIIDAMKHGKVWVLVKHSEVEALVELSSTNKLNKYLSNNQPLHLLEFDACCSSSEGERSEH